MDLVALSLPKGTTGFLFPNLQFFSQAVFFPDILYRLGNDGKPEFPEFAAKIKPTEFAPGKVFGTDKGDD